MAAKGLTQERLAERVGVKQPTVSRWLRGAWPEVPYLPVIASELGVTVDDLLATSLPRDVPSEMAREADVLRARVQKRTHQKRKRG